MQRRIGTLTAAGVVALGALTSGAALAPEPGHRRAVAHRWRLRPHGAESSSTCPRPMARMLAVKEINAAGGVLGQPIDLIVHDSQYDMARDGPDRQAVRGGGQGPGLHRLHRHRLRAGSAPTFQAAGIPYITVGATSPKIPGQLGDEVFLAAFGDNVQAAAGAEYAMENFGDTAYLLSDKGIEYTTLLGDYFKDAFTAAGRHHRARGRRTRTTRPTSRPRSPRSRRSRSSPTSTTSPRCPTTSGTVVKQFRDAGLTGPIVGGDGYDTPDLVPGRRRRHPTTCTSPPTP